MNDLTPGDVIAKLEAFGSARQIADHLADRGIRGLRKDPTACPVATYVMAETGKRISISGVFWFVRAPRHKTVVTAETIGHFILGFDRGEFPELEAEDAS